MRIIFMGTPDFAVSSLDALFRSGHEIVGVFTKPDRPKNRGMKLTESPVKLFAKEKNLKIYQPSSLRDEKVLGEIIKLEPELIAVAAYGKILPSALLKVPRYGCINVHASLLPKYRGAAPINWAILNGEKETGITIMYMAEELDAGDIIAQEKIDIEPNENAEQLYRRLADIGGSLLAKVIPEIMNGSIHRIPQDASKVQYAPMLTKDMSRMDWRKPAKVLHDQVRGLYPWPSAVSEIDGTRCKILKTEVADKKTDAKPGTILSAGKMGMDIACGQQTVLRILVLKPDGKKEMDIASYVNGHKLSENAVVC